MIGTSVIRKTEAELAALRHAALIRIEEYLFRVTIWTHEEWEALPADERPTEAAPLEHVGWHRIEPVNPAIWFAPGDLLGVNGPPGPSLTWPPSTKGWSPHLPFN